MLYLMKSKYAIFSNFKVTKIKHSAFGGTQGLDNGVCLSYSLIKFENSKGKNEDSRRKKYLKATQNKIQLLMKLNDTSQRSFLD